MLCGRCRFLYSVLNSASPGTIHCIGARQLLRFAFSAVHTAKRKTTTTKKKNGKHELPYGNEWMCATIIKTIRINQSVFGVFEMYTHIDMHEQ